MLHVAGVGMEPHRFASTATERKALLSRPLKGNAVASTAAYQTTPSMFSAFSAVAGAQWFAATPCWSEGDSNCRSHPTKSLVSRRIGTDLLQPQTFVV